MEKYNKQRLENIQTIFEERTGVSIVKKKRNKSYAVRRTVAVAGLLLGFLTLSAFAVSKFSSIDGDELAFCSTYKGDGVFEIVITNFSDRKLELQDKVRVMRWSSGEEVEGEAEKIIFANRKIAAHSEGTILIDLSEGYDIAALEEPLPSGDWYYFVLTNNNFAFGQDWMCSADFDETAVNTVYYRAVAEETKEKMNEEISCSAILKFEDWVWPTVSEKISAPFGVRENGTFSDHINIAGNTRDKVYSVADGTVVQTGFDATYGNYVLIDLGEGITVKYGHLKKILTEEGEQVRQGQKIAELGKTGMAAGPNLSFAVYRDGEPVNPLAE